MSLEDTLSGWTGPSSTTEQEKQERTERMVREAIDAHAAFDDCTLTVYAKGSYANNTNVRTDSDVDVAVQCHNVEYGDEETAGARPAFTVYDGIWTPANLRDELGAALRAKFPNQVDDSGSVAFRVTSSSSRVEADVVPCFDYRYHFSGGGSRPGAKTFRKDNTSLINYPKQQLELGRAKNVATGMNYKKTVRILKRAENAMLADGYHREVPSFFIECLTYCCPNSVFTASSWTNRVRGVLSHIWNGLQGDEPSNDDERWLEANEGKYLFHPGQPWSRADGRDFAYATWNYLGFES